MFEINNQGGYLAIQILLQIMISWNLLFFYYIGSAEGHEYPDLQVGDEVNPRPFLGVEVYYVQVANSFDPLEM